LAPALRDLIQVRLPLRSEVLGLGETFHAAELADPRTADPRHELVVDGADPDTSCFPIGAVEHEVELEDPLRAEPGVTDEIAVRTWGTPQLPVQPTG
jgi:hypothetical protein